MVALVRGEFSKLFSTRLWLWLLLGAMALTALFASLNIAFNDDPDTLAPPVATGPGQQLLFATAASGSQTLVAVLAAVAVTGEFRHRTATASFLATPLRVRVMVAKLIAYAVVGAGFATACLGVVAAVGWPWLGALGIDLTFTGRGVPATAVGVVATGVAFGGIGIGIGAVLRDQVAAVVALLVYLFVAEPVITRIPALSDWTVYLPGPAAAALTQITLSDQDFLDPLTGGIVLAGYALAATVVGAWLVARRDLT